MENKTPRLRFKGYEDAWEQRKLSDLAGKTYGGGTPSTSNADYWTGDIPWFQSSDIAEDKIMVAGTNKHVSTSGISNSATQLVPGNSIAIVTRVGVGKLAFVPFVYTTSQDFLSLSNLKSEPIFTSYSCYKKLNSELELVQGTSIKGITKEELLAKTLFIPRFQEQAKIGLFLQLVDKLITLHQRKYDKLVDVKKSLLEKMFPLEGEPAPRIRFKGYSCTWGKCKFCDVVLIERGGSPRPIEDYITTESDGLNWVKIGDAPEQGNYITSTSEKIKPSGLSKTRQVVPGDLILSNSMSFGRPYIMAISGCIHDGWLLIRDENNNFVLEFLCHMLGTNQMLRQYKSLAAGSTVSNLNKELVGNTIISFPDKEEQNKISDILSKIDDLIALYQRVLEKLSNIKKSLLERMFV